MYDASWQPDETPLGCDCVDCRMYRVWETEGTDDWQPQAEGWSAWTATPQMADTGSESRGA